MALEANGMTMPVAGANVVTADGDKLGTVKEVSGDCFKVDASMQPDYWLGMDCIASSTTGEIRLTFPKDRLGEAKLSGPDDAVRINGAEHTGIHTHR